MKNIYKISALLCASLFVFSACVEENLEQPYKPAEVGDEITFGARAGFEDADPATKTVYGTPYTDETTNKTFHPIVWVNGDLIEIYSPEAGGINPCCYKITPVDVENPTQGKDYATLTRNNPEGSLQWSGDGDHNFYAMYPSSDTFKESSDAALKAGVKMDKAVVNGVVPDVQVPAEVVEPAEGSKDWVLKPNMDYAYMVAHNVGNRTKGLIPLSFYPIVTAVEIQMFFETKENESVGDDIINYDDNISITHVRVESDAMITGSFTCDLEKWTNKKNYPTCTGSAVAGYANSITVPVWYDKTPNDVNVSYEPVVVEDGGKLTFTVFLLPHSGETDVLESLKVSVSTNGGSAYVGKDLPGITIKKNLKNRIVNLALPLFSNKTKLNVGNWITQLEEQKPKTPIVGLSIPGTGGSFSFGSSQIGYAQQSSEMDIDAQWNIGVRAFEIVSNRPQNSTTSLGGQPVQCNGVDMEDNDGNSITVFSAIDDLVDRVTRTTDSEGNPVENSEFAVAILTYQPSGTNRPRNAAAYAKSMKLMFDASVETGGLKEYVDNKTIILFTPDLTISEVKNKVLILCRINQEGEGEPTENVETGNYPDLTTTNTDLNFTSASNTLEGYPVVLINGCGTAKDKWARRGWYIGDSPADNSANYNVDFDSSKNVEYYIVGSVTHSSDRADATHTYNYQPDNVISIHEDKVNFEYSTNAAPCWFQEWARVSPGGDNGYWKAESPGTHTDLFQWWYGGYAYRWKESYTEKLSHVTSTFDMAINNELEGKIVINSLCGYYIATGTNFNESYVPYGGSTYTGGTNGNIQGLATVLNGDFYNYILNCALNETTGPTGIVMMDYVSNDASDGGSYYIPGVIIANNFQ